MVWKRLNSDIQLRLTPLLHETLFSPAIQASKQRENQLSPDPVAEGEPQPPSLGPQFHALIDEITLTHLRKLKSHPEIVQHMNLQMGWGLHMKFPSRTSPSACSQYKYPSDAATKTT